MQHPSAEAVDPTTITVERPVVLGQQIQSLALALQTDVPTVITRLLA
ncbi:MAG: hypothetical protein HC837_05845 [Chloroflexaceae bacterium]|nr:hypothetical protein [Chloroflexaceae bacterium]